ncbi:MAG: DNA adenine methylase [Acidobacteriia bacterium]|nr:DNA adenine methylase [Terriglobia bacterium]
MVGPVPYIGGKNRIATKIIKIFPPHTTYVEAFGGGAQVLFRKELSSVEVLNDMDGDVANFFRICQRHHGELCRYLRFTIVSRKWFSLFESENPESLTDIQRAARFLYLQKNAFAGLVRRRRYHYAVSAPPSFNPGNIPKLLESAHRRLVRVQIECLPYGEIIKRFDRPDTLFYLDPPYFEKTLYRFNFTEDDFRILAERLHLIQGKFVLSINDVPEIREIFQGFHFREIALHYTAQREAGKRFPELLITNFPS